MPRLSILGYIKIDWTIWFIGIFVIYYFLNELLDLLHIVSNSCYVIRHINIQFLHVSKVLLLPFIGKCSKLLLSLIGSINYFVVDICYVHAELDVILEVIYKYFSDDIKCQVSSCVPHVTNIVNSWATHIPIHYFPLIWHKLLELHRNAIEKF